MNRLRHVMKMPVGIPLPGWLLEAGAFLVRTETELVLKSRRVVPARLTDSGYSFRYPVLNEALRDLLK